MKQIMWICHHKSHVGVTFDREQGLPGNWGKSRRILRECQAGHLVNLEGQRPLPVNDGEDACISGSQRAWGTQELCVFLIWLMLKV